MRPIRSQNLVEINLDEFVEKPIDGRAPGKTHPRTHLNKWGTVLISKDFVKDDEFILQIADDSMNGIGLNDGDFVVVREHPHINQGDIIAAVIDGEYTIKRFYSGNDKVQLIPENPNIEAMIFDKEDVKIIGKVMYSSAIQRH